MRDDASRPMMKRNRLISVALAIASLALVIAGGRPLDAQSVRTPGGTARAAAVEAAARKYFPGEDDAAPAKRLFRLTRDQIDATVRWLLPGYAATSLKERMPRDPLQTNYEYAELLALNAANLGALTGWIGEIAERVRRDPARLVPCPGAEPARACLELAARAFLDKAFRGDLAPERADRLTVFFVDGVKVAGLGPAAGDLVEVVLNSPEFLFRAEIDSDRRGRLRPTQLLQALTYTLADAPPAALALDPADALAHLQTDDSTHATVERILESTEARAKLVRFFRTWLEIREPGEFAISREVFPEFTPALAAAMVEETDRYLRDKLAGPSPSLAAITQSHAWPVAAALAPLYGVKSSDTRGAGAAALDPAQRLGIFSQAAVIASHSGPTNTRLVKRGTFWARKVMCLEFGAAPKTVHESQYGTLVTTERQRIEKATRHGACMGCHKAINPFAYALESYDALGRWRTLDNGHLIDPSIDIDFLDEGSARAATTVEALRTLTGSLMFKQCFVRQMFRFYMGRGEERADDSVLRQMFFALAADERGDILASVRTLALSDRIRRREL